MITITADIICDACLEPIASGEPSQNWRAAVISAERAAQARGAELGVATVTCCTCQTKPKEIKPAEKSDVGLDQLHGSAEALLLGLYKQHFNL